MESLHVWYSTYPPHVVSKLQFSDESINKYKSYGPKQLEYLHGHQNFVSAWIHFTFGTAHIHHIESPDTKFQKNPFINKQVMDLNNWPQGKKDSLFFTMYHTC